VIHSGLQDFMVAKTIVAKVIRGVYSFIHFIVFSGDAIFKNLDEVGLLV